MHWFAALNLIGTALLLLLASFTGQRPESRKNVGFILLLLAMATYSLALAFESLASDLSGAWFWNRIQYLSIPFLPALMLLVVGRYVGLPFQHPWLKAVLIGSFGFSLLITLLHWSSPWHDLYYRNIAFTVVDDVAAVSFTPGLFYHLFDVFYLSNAAIALVLVGRRAFQVYGLFRTQAVAVFIGIIIPWLFALVGDFASLPTDLDIVPLAFVPSALVLGFGVLNWGLLGLEPIVMRTVFGAIPSGCIIVDHNRRLLDCNVAAQQMFPGLTQLKTGESIDAIYDDLPGFGAVLEALNDRDHWLIWSPDNRTHYRVQLTWLEQHQMHLGYLILIQDETQQVTAEALLRERAELDGLTGVLNRSSFDEHLNRAVEDNARAGTSLALILFDLDHFKALNDTQGHQAGDEVLKTVARCAYDLSRHGDSVARYGGEEFALILPKTNLAGARAIAERLREVIAHDTPVTASLGIALTDSENGQSPAELIHHADQALYRAKRSGRNTVEVADVSATGVAAAGVE